MSTVRQRIFVCLIALVMVFGVVISAAPDIAYAAGSELSYDKTNVMDDLASSTVNGQPFDVKDYPYDEDRRRSSISWSIATRTRAICRAITGCMSMYITLKG